MVKGMWMPTGSSPIQILKSLVLSKISYIGRIIDVSKQFTEHLNGLYKDIRDLKQEEMVKETWRPTGSSPIKILKLLVLSRMSYIGRIIDQCI